MSEVPNPDNLPYGSFMMDTKKEGLVDLEKLTDQIIEFVEYIKTPEMRQMEETGKGNYVHHLETKFETFTLDNYKIFRLLTDDYEKLDSNLQYLTSIIKRLYNNKNDKFDLETEIKKISNDVAEKHFYPSYGGKDAYERAMVESQMLSNSGIKLKKKRHNKGW